MKIEVETQKKLTLEDIINEIENSEIKSVFIRPFAPRNIENFGLEQYGEVLFPNTRIIESLGYVDLGYGKRYLTGLDEETPSINKLPDDIKTREKIRIRKEVSYIEYKTSFTRLDIYDPEFWSKVRLLRPDNYEYWMNKTITLDNNVKTLNLLDPDDRITYNCILGGGYSYVARSQDVAYQDPRKYKYYLDVPNVVSHLSTLDIKEKNKALGELHKLYEENKYNHLFSILKSISISGVGMRRSSMNLDTVYLELDNLLNKHSDKNRYRSLVSTAQNIIKLANMPYKKAAIHAFVTDLITGRNIHFKELEGQFYSQDLGENLGSTLEQVVDYLSSDIGRESLKRLAVLYGNLCDFDMSLIRNEETDLTNTNIRSQEPSEKPVDKLVNKLKKQ